MAIPNWSGNGWHHVITVPWFYRKCSFKPLTVLRCIKARIISWLWFMINLKKKKKATLQGKGEMVVQKIRLRNAALLRCCVRVGILETSRGLLQYSICVTTISHRLRATASIVWMVRIWLATEQQHLLYADDGPVSQQCCSKFPPDDSINWMWAQWIWQHGVIHWWSVDSYCKSLMIHTNLSNMNFHGLSIYTVLACLL